MQCCVRHFEGERTSTKIKYLHCPRLAESVLVAETAIRSNRLNRPRSLRMACTNPNRPPPPPITTSSQTRSESSCTPPSTSEPYGPPAFAYITSTTSPLSTAIFPILISSIMRESTLVIAWDKSLIVKCNASLRYPPSERDCEPCSKGGDGSDGGGGGEER